MGKARLSMRRGIASLTALGLGIGSTCVAAALGACTSKSSGPGSTDASFDEFDATFDGGEDGAPPDGGSLDTGSPGTEGGSTYDGSCGDAAVGPLGLTCDDFPGVAPCPDQSMLTDATKLATLQKALASGALELENDPFDSSNPNIYKVVCGLTGYWDPSKATTFIPPATNEPDIASLFAPSPDGFAGVCANYMAWSVSNDGFPAAGVYRKQLRATYQGQTYTVRLRYTASGSLAGTTWEGDHLSDGGYYASSQIAQTMTFQVNGNTVAEPSLWSSMIQAFAASTTSFPSVTLGVKETPTGPTGWTGKFELLCASASGLPDAGPSAVGAQATIALPGTPGALAYDRGAQKVYVALSTVSDAGFTEPGGVAVVDDTTNAVTGNVAATNTVVAMAANGTTNVVYASEQTQIDVISGTTISTTIQMPVGSGYAEGFAVDEANNQVYVLGDSQLLTLSGTSNTFTGTPIALSGFTPPIAAFSAGKNALAYDASAHTLYAIGLDSSLNGVIQSFDAQTGKMLSGSSLSGWQPQSIVAVAGGAIATVVNTSGGAGLVVVGQMPTMTSYSPSSLALCGSTLAVIGSDSTGLAAFQTYAANASALGTANTPDPLVLQQNGQVPSVLAAAGTVGTGCAYYTTYAVSPNALYSNVAGYVPAAAPYLVKFVSP
jgi:hypothetical protein